MPSQPKPQYIFLTSQNGEKVDLNIFRKGDIQEIKKAEFIISTDPEKVNLNTALECSHQCSLTSQYPGITHVSIQDIQA